jgi:predicted short-subunit dehydrogenase-like oxidoreductase (DUF2520 family)
MTFERTAGTSPVLNIIGCGRAAGSLALLWREAREVRVGSVLNRSRRSAQAAVDRIGAGVVADSVGDMPRADIWLIGCGDDQVSSVALALAEARDDLEGALVFHLAGRFGLDVLAPLAGQGARVAALHPVRSLTDARLDIADFAGTACVAEGSAEAFEQLEPLVQSIGGHWLPVRDIDRGLYHAAVSIISNVTKGVAWKAQNWLVHAGLPAATADAVTYQLLNSTVQDLLRSGARQSITGPVVRGDTRTVEAHLDALRRSHPGDMDVYRILANTVLELAQERGDLDADTLARFKALLSG